MISDILVSRDDHEQLLAKLDRMLADTTPNGEMRRKKWRERIKLLILSKNAIHNADSHPFGIFISIALQSEKTQESLNVKRLKKTSDVAGESRTIPTVNITVLYEPDQCDWVRCLMAVDLNVAEYADVLAQKFPTYSHFAKLSDEVFEFYFYHGREKKHRIPVEVLLNAFNECQWVRRIVFHCNCRAMQEAMLKGNIDRQTFIDNLCKFLYCNLTNSIVFSVDQKNEYLVMRSMLYSIISYYYYKAGNMKSAGTIMGTPISTMTGESPVCRLGVFRKEFEPITTLDEEHISLGHDIRDTSTTFNLSNNELRHRLHALNNNRDYRMLGLSSCMGAKNINELSFSILNGGELSTVKK